MQPRRCAGKSRPCGTAGGEIGRWLELGPSLPRLAGARRHLAPGSQGRSESLEGVSIGFAPPRALVECGLG